MWVILHNILITNAALYDRHMHPDGLCGTCSDQRESCIHVLQDCMRSRQIWFKLGVNESDIDFWSTNERQWLVGNIKLSNRNGIENWKSLFCVACWLIWRRRNEVIHNNLLES